MVSANPFPGWLAEVATDAVVVRPDDIETEARCNLWAFTLTPEQVPFVTPTDVESFATVVADSRRAWLITHGIDSMTLYWWHDEQAGQLRFSLVSASHGRLPFECEVVLATSLHEITVSWLASSHLRGISWDELRALGPDEMPPDPPPTVLPVWSRLLP